MAILYGSNDDICKFDTISLFVEHFECNLEIMDKGEHYFHTKEQLEYFEEIKQEISLHRNYLIKYMKTMKSWLSTEICGIMYVYTPIYLEVLKMMLNKDKKWDYAFGMIKVDGLEPTPEFKKLVEKEKSGEITMADIKKALDKKYKMK